jgi:hypothetical protein
MALERVFLRAHHRHRPPLQFLAKAVKPRLERIGFPARLIVNQPIGTIGIRIIRTAAQFLSQKEVLELFSLEEFFEGRQAEMRQACALRSAAHIDDQLNAMVFQQCSEVFKFQDRMADGEKRVKAVRVGGVTVSRRHGRFLEAGIVPKTYCAAICILNL